MKIYLVGGAVRDKLLGLPVKEKDWVVVGASADDMLKLGYRQVGKEFPVFLHPKTSEEYALARMERKVLPGYRGFEFDTSPKVKLEDDLIRRDLTINAMAEDEAGNLFDFYNGKKDLEEKILRHVSPAFKEDPVRILRVGRLLARYYHLGFHIADETMELMRIMVQAGEVDALVAERVWKELDRALAEKNPEKFFEVLAECNALEKLFPGLDLNGPAIQTLRNAARLSKDAVIRFAALMSFYKVHEMEKICDRYKAPNEYRELARLAINYHKQTFAAESFTAGQLLHLYSGLDVFRREERFRKFVMVCNAIAETLNNDFDAEWLIEGALAAKSCDVKKLIAEGFKSEALAKKLREMRIVIITEWLEK